MLVSSAIVPCGRDLAELHEVRVIGEPADDVQVVLDDAHRASLLAHGLDQVEDRVDPSGVDAGRRLVEQEHLGLGGQHARQRDELGLPVRQARRPARRRTRPCRRIPTSPSRPFAVCSSTPTTRRWANASVAKFSPAWCCTAIITFCRHDSRLNSRTSWYERTKPLRATWCRVEPDQLLAVQLHRAGVGRDGAGQQVEHGRLPGAVRADEGGDRAAAQLDVQVVGGDDAAEALADTAGLEHDRRVEPLLVAIDLVRDVFAAVRVDVSIWQAVDVIGSLRCTLVHADALAAPNPRPSRRDRDAPRSPRSHRHSEKPSGSAPCGRTRISTASASP